jgi:hypothetical protein
VSTAQTVTWERLIADLPADLPASPDPAGGAGRTDDAAGQTLADHRQHRVSWYAALVGPLVLPDTALARTARTAPAEQPVEVLVRNSGGAGGLVALGRRQPEGLRVVGVESPLRDLDDLPGSASRLVVAAEELSGTEVFVGLPPAPGWIRAVELVEAAGLLGSLTPARLPATDPASNAQLAEQLSVLVEADLPFRLTWPASPPGTGATGAVAAATVALLMALEALVDGATPAEAADLLGLRDPARARAGLARWDQARATRVRRRLRGVAAPVAEVVAGLESWGLLTAPAGTA